MTKIDGIGRGVFIRPPEEVMRIVRCKNCEHWDESWCERVESKFGYCGELDMMTAGVWWCGSREVKNMRGEE